MILVSALVLKAIEHVCGFSLREGIIMIHQFLVEMIDQAPSVSEDLSIFMT
jgi:hypothetical protein